MKKKFFVFVVSTILMFLFISLISGAHYIVGDVQDALDGTFSNGKIVVLWNPENGILDNRTDIIGPEGDSGADNIYMIDCEMLQTSCMIGDVLSIKVFNEGDGYATAITNVTVTGAGYTQVETMILNSPPFISSITVKDSLENPLSEINLVAASSKKIICEGVAFDYDGSEELKNPESEFFHLENSYFGNEESKNYHYINESCIINTSYGTLEEALIKCEFEIFYYANEGEWNCTLSIEDGFLKANKSNSSYINSLIAIGTQGSINFGEMGLGGVSSEVSIEIINYGNTNINLSLSGYAEEPEDELAMKCFQGDIEIHNKKYNLTSSNDGEISLEDFNNLYQNLTSLPQIRKFNLDYRKEGEAEEDAMLPTYWRIYVPPEIGGICSGNIVFGAIRQSETN